MVRGRGATINPFLVQQAAAAALGFLVMAIVMHVDYRKLRDRRVVYALVAGVLVLLVAVLFSPQLNATRRWFFIAGISVQPSELSKLALVPFLAFFIDRRKDAVNSREVLWPAAIVTGLLAGLILLQPDLGTAVLLVSTAGLMLFLAGLSWRFVLAGRGDRAAGALPAGDLGALPPGAALRLPRAGARSSRRRLPGDAVAHRRRLRAASSASAPATACRSSTSCRIRNRTSSTRSSPRSSG